MKKLINLAIVFLAIAFAGHSLWAFEKIENLKLSCSFEAEITNVQSYFTKGEPAKYRHPGIPNTVNYQFSINIKSIDSGCEPLKTKYLISTLNQKGYGQFIGENVDLPIKLKNSTVKFRLKQNFGYLSEDQTILPLFPLVHKEELIFEASIDDLNLIIDQKFDLQKVYNIKPKQFLTESEKIDIVKIASVHIMPKKNYYPSLYNEQFANLVISLEPKSIEFIKNYSDIIWSTFNKYKLTNPYLGNMFDFNSGGVGSYFAKPLVEQIIKISNFNIYSENQINYLALDMPNILLTSTAYSKCLPITSKTIDFLLSYVEEKSDVFGAQDKNLFEDILPVIAEKTGAITNCTKGFVSDNAKQKALELYNKIYKN